MRVLYPDICQFLCIASSHLFDRHPEAQTLIESQGKKVASLCAVHSDAKFFLLQPVLPAEQSGEDLITNKFYLGLLGRACVFSSLAQGVHNYVRLTFFLVFVAFNQRG